jgi:REP element-mobilizing transposase RayT
MIPLEPDNMYHIFNHGNGNDIIFKNDGNYHFFLNKYKKFISPIVDTYCYCLLPKHFHLLLRIKDKEGLLRFFNPICKDKRSKEIIIENQISKLFSNFFSSYAQAFNKQQNRMGSLFMKNFKRKKVTDKKYLRNVVLYIHNNPVEAGFCQFPEEWEFSSYRAIINGNDSEFLTIKEVIEWFGDKDNFIYCHKFPPEI